MLSIAKQNKNKNKIAKKKKKCKNKTKKQTSTHFQVEKKCVGVIFNRSSKV